MSTQKLRELKLYKKLQKDLNYRDKLQQKIKQISQTNPSTSSSQITRKLNNNKKYFQQQQKNAQIQRENLILFQKIQSQGLRSHYHKKIHQKNRSSKTLNQMDDYNEPKYEQRKHNNYSQNKINYRQENSRVSFQQNQEMMRPRQHSKKHKLLTQLTPEVMQIFRSRIMQSKMQAQQNILFQGIAEIDSIRFKVKISIKNKVYCLSGKNKHTDILLKMEINQYKKFHKEVLVGNPSNIFQYLMIDKGQIKFRTEEHQINTENSKQKIYQIDEQEDESEDIAKKFKQQKNSQPKKSYRVQTEEPAYQGRRYKGQKGYEYERIQPLTISVRSQVDKRNSEKLLKRQKIPIQNQSGIHPKNSNYEKYRTLQDYINDKDQHRQSKKYKNQNQDYRNIKQYPKQIFYKKQGYPYQHQHENYAKQGHQRDHRDIYPKQVYYPKQVNSGGSSTQIQAKNMRNRYRLPYL